MSETNLKKECCTNPIDLGALYMPYDVMEDTILNGGIAIPEGTAFQKYQPPCWDVWFMRFVYLVASKSKDNSSKIGAVIVKDNKRPILFGYNGLPIGVEDRPERLERPDKYMYTEHGERNAIYCGAAFGIACEGTTMYTQGLPCADCARGVIQARIKRLVVHFQYEQVFRSALVYSDQWKRSHEISKIMLTEAGVEIKVLDARVGSVAHAGGKEYLV